jgi:hypothetical protein
MTKGPQDCKTARPQDRKTARPQDCKTARLQDFSSVEALEGNPKNLHRVTQRSTEGHREKSTASSAFIFIICRGKISRKEAKKTTRGVNRQAIILNRIIIFD